MTKKIAYICDRQKCPRCSPECMHTTDIHHAYRFKLQDGTDDTWFEESTIDVVVPVRHGHWIKEFENEDGRSLRCSECRMVFYVGKGRDGYYCPNCGAKMR